MAGSWDEGHEWLWGRLRRMRWLAGVLLVVGLGAGLVAGYGLGRIRHTDASVQIIDASSKVAATQLQSPSEPSGQLQAPGEASRSAAPALTLDDRPTRGSADAKVTIVEFSDFQCPFCLRHERDVEPILLDAGGPYAGKLRYVIKSFPLPIHPQARGAAEAAECAKNQGRYWEYHAVLFADQDQLDPAALASHAKAVGLDQAAFDRCVSTHATAAVVDRDIQEGANLGVTGTPTFFINGIRMPGAQPLEVFEQVIDRLLAGRPVQLVSPQTP